MASSSSSVITSPHFSSIHHSSSSSKLFSNFSFSSSAQLFSPVRNPGFQHRSRSITRKSKPLSIHALTLNFTGSFFEGGGEDENEEPSSGSTVALEEKEELQCPPGLRQYETMVVLRPDMSEEERLALTQKYEELLVAGGGMYVEVFNRGVIPLAYGIKKKNKAGESNTYLDGIYLLFTYFTKPESMDALETRLNTDDDVIRSSSFKIRKRKY